ncbi:MAG: ribosomal protein, partial [Frankiales bacterium]|nr:ribosomal protein [Frankiales bacterium]
AVAEGLMARAGASASGDDKPEAGQLGTDEPLPEWEQELLKGGNDAPAADVALESGAAAAAAGVDTATVEGAGAAEAPATEVEGAAAGQTNQPPAAT